MAISDFDGIDHGHELIWAPLTTISPENKNNFYNSLLKKVQLSPQLQFHINFSHFDSLKPTLQIKYDAGKLLIFYACWRVVHFP